MEFIYQSDSIKNITATLLKMQPDVKTFVKTGDIDPKNKRFKCVKLEKILEVMKPICEKHKVFLKPDIVYADGNQFLKLQLIDKETTEFFATYVYLFPICEMHAANQQDLGKVITYQFRHALRVLFALEIVEEDLDQPLETDYLNDSQIDILICIAGDNKSALQELKKVLNINSGTDILKDDFHKAIKVLVEIVKR